MREFAKQNKALNYAKQLAVDMTGMERKFTFLPGRFIKQWAEVDVRPEGTEACSDTCLFIRS